VGKGEGEMRKPGVDAKGERGKVEESDDGGRDEEAATEGKGYRLRDEEAGDGEKGRDEEVRDGGKGRGNGRWRGAERGRRDEERWRIEYLKTIQKE
jgi:hypothetical protein